ncbi:cytochrome P450 2K4 isoform X2 [Microcaecilia unicolor]|uniref:Cytochrome P450 2K4-like isoform X2 n=1 Tax=Microcaecilia unicolor TaxID=1415580 RepID=A0A6P7XVV5_9AMPH|nr:cytochrome P450 2K4-like isoform X2 [Microcaecilia unicolor]
MCFSVLTILFLVGVITLICYISGVNVWKRNIQQNFPPGPRPLPLIGNLHIMNLKRPHKTLCKLSEKYGSVFSIQMGMKKMVILTGYETVKEALVSHADVFEERAIIPVFEDVAKGHGIIFSHGETWKVMRKFTMKTLRDFGMGKRTIEDKIIEECGFLINHFESFHGTPFDTLMSITLPVANIIASILQGYRFDYNDPVLRRLIHLNDKADRLLGSPMVSEKDNPNTYFNEDNLVNLVQNLLGAGMGTTSTTIRWSLLIMMKYPKIQEKVQEEIERVIGSSQPRAEHWKLMPYTNAVIHEVQRFANIVPMNLPHETTRDINFKGYFLPKGTFIVPLLESVLRDKTYFENPEEFKPQHFLDSGGKFVRKDAFMPFSAGRRVCAGETLAKMELFLFFISLLQKFTICLPPGVTDVDLMPAIGLATRPMPHLICALPRS